jgi:hypothetical protein
MTILKGMDLVVNAFFFSMPKYRRFTTPGAGPFWSLDKKFPLAKFHIEFCIISLWVSHIYREKERGWEYSQNDTNHIRLGHRKAEEKTKEKTVESIERIGRFKRYRREREGKIHTVDILSVSACKLE